MKYNGMRMLTDLVSKGVLGPSSSIGKLYWSNWHRTLGERAMHVLGADAGVIAGAPGERLRARRAPPHLHGQPVGDDLRRCE